MGIGGPDGAHRPGSRPLIPVCARSGAWYRYTHESRRRAMRFSRSLLVFLALVVVSCASTPPVVRRGQVPIGSELAVIPFRDCLIAKQEDCDGSGNTAGNIFAQVF